jgi:hypothetical protein
MGKTIAVAGSLAQRPRLGGHTWVFLQYLLGFKRLGWDVLFLDRLEPEMYMEADGECCSLEDSLNLRYFLDVMGRFGLTEAFSISYNQGQQFIGLARQQVLERVKNSAFLLNVMGFLDDGEVLQSAPKRVFLDIDPGFGQMWRELGLADLFRGHDHFITIGENIGLSGCEVPTCGLSWITTPQPVVLEHWPVHPAGREAFTSIVSWRGPFGPIQYQDKTYGLRVHEFRKFAPLPRMGENLFELALDIHAAEVNDIELLTRNNWCLVDPASVAGDPMAYRSYIQNSKAEFMVAKNLYVETKGGWLSDRSLCYLASGNPVLAQDTGLRHRYPSGEGLVFFSTLEEAQAGVEDISQNYARHARAARALAEEHFDSDIVLPRLLEALGVT